MGGSWSEQEWSHRGTDAAFGSLGGIQLVSSSGVIKVLAVLLLVLACVSHSMLIYQLSNISQISRSLSELNSPNPPTSQFQSQFHAKTPDPNYAQFQKHESGQSSNSDEGKGQKTSRDSEAEFTSNQLLTLIVNSHIQQQNQFQQIMKNSLTVLEVMTNNMNSINMLVSSQLSQQGSLMNEFSKSMNKNEEDNRQKDTNVKISDTGSNVNKVENIELKLPDREMRKDNVVGETVNHKKSSKTDL